MSPLLYPFFNTVFISHCVNTLLPAHTVLCKLFKHSGRRTQTSSSAETSHRDTGHSQRRERLFSSKLQSQVLGTWWGGEEGEGRRFYQSSQDLLCSCAGQDCLALPCDTRMKAQAPVWGTGTTCPMSTPCCHTSLDALV